MDKQEGFLRTSEGQYYYLDTNGDVQTSDERKSLKSIPQELAPADIFFKKNSERIGERVFLFTGDADQIMLNITLLGYGIESFIVLEITGENGILGNLDFTGLECTVGRYTKVPCKPI